MSHAYYTSGEKNLETGEYELPEIEDDDVYWRPNSNDTKEKRYNFPLPKQFHSAYYSEKLSKLNNESRDYWDIKYLARYAYAVCEFYIKVVKEFAENFACPHVVEDWASERTISSDLQTLADNLLKAESNLTNQFTKFSDRSVGTFLNRSEIVRDYGAKAWIMYNALNNEIHIDYAKKFADACNGYDLYHSHHDQVMAYRGSKIMLREMKLLKKNNFMCSAQYKHGDVYSKFEAVGVYDSLMSEMNIHTSSDYQRLEREMYPVLNEHAKEDDDIRDIFFFYNKYDEIKDLLYRIKCVNNSIADSDYSYNMFLYAYNDSSKGDMFVLAYRYSLFLDRLLTIVEDPLIIRDVQKLLDRLNNLIAETKPHYEKCHLIKDSNFLEKYSRHNLPNEHRD